MNAGCMCTQRAGAAGPCGSRSGLCSCHSKIISLPTLALPCCFQSHCSPSYSPPFPAFTFASPCALLPAPCPRHPQPTHPPWHPLPRSHQPLHLACPLSQAPSPHAFTSAVLVALEPHLELSSPTCLSPGELAQVTGLAEDDKQSWGGLGYRSGHTTTSRVQGWQRHLTRQVPMVSLQTLNASQSMTDLNCGCLGLFHDV